MNIIWIMKMTNKLLKKLGENLRKIRAAKKMSQGDVCRKLLRMDRNYISGIENGRRNVTILTIGRLAEALGVSVEELLK